MKILKGPSCYYLLSSVLLSLTQIPQKNPKSSPNLRSPPTKCLHPLSALTLLLSIKNAKTLNQITMATSPSLIFSKTPNFFNCKSIANPNRRPVLRAHSPSGRFYTSPLSNSCASSTSAFSSSPWSFFQNRSASATRVNVYGSSPSASNIRFSLDNRQISPSRSISVILRSNNSNQASKKQLDKPRRMCMCSPTSHPDLERSCWLSSSHRRSLLKWGRIESGLWMLISRKEVNENIDMDLST
ncbi:hypothetical protein Lser_V15G06654 [Lactuca serriola]